MRSIFIFTLIATICFGKAISQQPGKFHISYYTTENGLPSNGIKGLQWDEQSGFLWIATEAGVSRFNGLDFKNFTTVNTPFISSERMLFLVRNNAGRIYTSDVYGNLLYVRDNYLLPYQKSPNTHKNSYNNRFAITVSDTLFNSETEYVGSMPIALTFSSVLPKEDTSCYIIHNGKIYKHSTSLSDAIPYRDSSFSVQYGFKLQNKCFVIDHNTMVYELNDDPAKNKIFPVLNEDGSRFDLSDRNNRFFWMNGMENPILINKNNAWACALSGNNITATKICSDVPTDALIDYVQYIQQKKMLFLGTKSKGIIVLSENRVDAMKSRMTGTNDPNAYYAQIELPDENVLTNSGHIIGDNIISSSAITPIKGPFDPRTSTTDSMLWYSQFNTNIGYGCLHGYNFNTRQTKVYKYIMTAEIVINKMADGRLLAVTEYGLGWLFDDSIHYLYRHPEINYDNTSFKMEEIEPGIVLLATCTGILKYNTHNNKLDTVLNTIGFCIRSIWKYKDYIFFGTYGKGYLIWKNGIIKSMPIDKRGYLLHTHCFIPDDQGYCWISTNRGLFKANIGELINAYEKNTQTVYYHYFGKNDGMDIMEMNGGCSPCALQLKNKTLSFPTMDGLLWVDPEKAKPILPDGEIFIDELIADSIRIDPEQAQEIILPAETNEIAIRLTYSGWCNKENIYIDYQLNDTANWRPVNTDADALIHLGNLVPGDYILRFRKMNGFGINNYSYKTILFTIITPWYKTWWFNVLLVFAFAGLILLYVNFRTRQLKINQQKLEKQVAEKTKELKEKNEVLEKNDSIKTRLISIISHDIVTPLKFLTAAGKNLIEKRKIMPEELQNETLEEMANTSQELQMLSTNILNWIKYQNENRRLVRENFNLHELVDQVIGILKSLARSKNLALKNQVDAQLSMYQYVEPLKILIYNLLTNAINFSERGEIIVGAEEENELLKIWVKDDGRGMTQDQIQHLMADEIIITSANADKRKGHGLGYLIIKDLLKMTGGTLSIQSEKGKGSMISIILPANQKNHLGE